MVGQKLRARSPAGAVKVALVEDSFRHEALFYNGEDGFCAGRCRSSRKRCRTTNRCSWPFARSARLLERALGDDAASVRFVDMRRSGATPRA